MQCTYTKIDNTQCKANALSEGVHCYQHSSDIKESEKQAARSRGGKANAITISNPLPPVKIETSKDVVGLLVETINEVRSGNMDVKISNAIGVLSGQLIKALEVANIENRVEIIERAVLERKTIVR